MTKNKEEREKRNNQRPLFFHQLKMNLEIKNKIIQVCNDKIAKKGDNVGLSFYAFFKNKNDNPKLLLEVATWWIETHQLDHFEKAMKIKEIVKNIN